MIILSRKIVSTLRRHVNSLHSTIGFMSAQAYEALPFVAYPFVYQPFYQVDNRLRPVSRLQPRLAGQGQGVLALYRHFC